MTTLLVIFMSFLLAIMVVSLWLLERMPRWATEGQRVLVEYYVQEIQTERGRHLRQYQGLFSKTLHKRLDNHS